MTCTCDNGRACSDCLADPGGCDMHAERCGQCAPRRVSSLDDVRAAAERLEAVIGNFQGRSTPLNNEQEDVLLLCRYAKAMTEFRGARDA